jgi:hypothetical protein
MEASVVKTRQQLPIEAYLKADELASLVEVEHGEILLIVKDGIVQEIKAQSRYQRIRTIK